MFGSNPVWSHIDFFVNMICYKFMNLLGGKRIELIDNESVDYNLFERTMGWSVISAAIGTVINAVG